MTSAIEGKGACSTYLHTPYIVLLLSTLETLNRCIKALLQPTYRFSIAPKKGPGSILLASGVVNYFASGLGMM